MGYPHSETATHVANSVVSSVTNIFVYGPIANVMGGHNIELLLMSRRKTGNRAFPNVTRKNRIDTLAATILFQSILSKLPVLFIPPVFYGIRVVTNQELVFRINLRVDAGIKGGDDLTGISLNLLLQYISRNIVAPRLLLDYRENFAIVH